MASGDDLPNEILALIFDRLPCPVLWCTVRAVCTRWAAIVNDRMSTPGRDKLCFSRDRTLAKKSCWCEAAAGVAHTHCIEYALLVGAPWDKETCAAAAGGGHLCLLAALHEMGCPWGPSLYARAAAGGHTNCVEYAHQNGCRWDATACQAAAGAGRDVVLDYLIAEGCPFDQDAACAAAGAGRFACLVRLCAAGVALDADVYGEAVRSGSVLCLEYLEAHYCPRDPAAMMVAAGAGDAVMVAYLDGVGFVWDGPCSVRAVAGGHVSVLAYAHERMGATLGNHLCQVAAARGRVDVLAWLCAHGCVASKDTYRAAVNGGHANVLTFLTEHGHAQGSSNSNTRTDPAVRDRIGCIDDAPTHGGPRTVPEGQETFVVEHEMQPSPSTKRRRTSDAI
ncbi:Ankyrin repeat protein [Pandoravirus kuranda]|uniref:Ankyrin repeat protein n=1 Tax=Pandoravirus kuranda TaxID=3019033 RepID=A0AA95EF26_9VIRU|nr:Ankyrin repeat protein [Pandoravirus kuranda]